MGEGDQFGVPGREHGDKALRQEDDEAIHDDSETRHRLEEEAHEFPVPGVVVLAVEVAHERLDALGYPQEDGEDDKRHIADSEVGGEADFSKPVQIDGDVVEQGDDADGEFHYKGRRAKVDDIPGQARRQGGPGEAEQALPPEKVRQKDHDGEDGPEGGRQGGAGDAHIERIHENVVENNVRQRPDDEGGYRQLRPVVGPRIGTEGEGENKERRPGDDIPQVRHGLGLDVRRRPKGHGELSEVDVPEHRHRDGHGDGDDDGQVEGAVGPFPVARSERR